MTQVGHDELAGQEQGSTIPLADKFPSEISSQLALRRRPIQVLAIKRESVSKSEHGRRR